MHKHQKAICSDAKNKNRITGDNTATYRPTLKIWTDYLPQKIAWKTVTATMLKSTFISQQEVLPSEGIVGGVSVVAPENTKVWHSLNFL